MPSEPEQPFSIPLRIALEQSMSFQLLICDRLEALCRTGHSWTLTGGSTEDDGENLRVTIHLETRYAPRSVDPDRRPPVPEPAGEGEPARD